MEAHPDTVMLNLIALCQLSDMDLNIPLGLVTQLFPLPLRYRDGIRYYYPCPRFNYTNECVIFITFLLFIFVEIGNVTDNL